MRDDKIFKLTRRSLCESFSKKKRINSVGSSSRHVQIVLRAASETRAIELKNDV